MSLRRVARACRACAPSVTVRLSCTARGAPLFRVAGALARAREFPRASWPVGLLPSAFLSCSLPWATSTGSLPTGSFLAATRSRRFLCCPLRHVEVVAHGADVRLLLAASRGLRAHVLRALLRQGARFTFAAESLLAALVGSLPPDLAASLTRVARVEAPPIEIAVDAARSAKLRAACDLGPGQILAVSVGRLVPEKRVSLAIAAADCAGGRVRLVIVGDGPERPSLEQIARASSAPVAFAGRVPRPLALAWIRAADVLVHTSAAEGAPTAPREARAIGIPVVACPAGDIAAWARVDPGIAICAPSPMAVAEAILGLSGCRARKQNGTERTCILRGFG